MPPGLLQKSEACNTSEGKFHFKAFLLDLQSLSSIQVEAEWEEKARRQDTSSWIEVPPPELRKTHTSEAEKRLLEKILQQQKGRPHPQPPDDEEMRLYWLFQQIKDETTNRRDMSARLKAVGNVPKNKAALGAVSDYVTSAPSDFGGKGVPVEESQVGNGTSRKGGCNGAGKDS